MEKDIYDLLEDHRLEKEHLKQINAPGESLARLEDKHTKEVHDFYMKLFPIIY